MKKITLTGNPISTQNAYLSRGKRRFLSHKARTRKQQYEWEVKNQWKGEPLEGDLSIDIVLYFGTKRRVDWDNFHKISTDSLEGIVFKDDSQIQEAHVIKDYDKENPRIEMVIHSLTD